MSGHPFDPCSAFDGSRLLFAGPLPEAALAVKRAAENGAAGPLLVFDDATARVIDLDLRGADADVLARLAPSSPESGDAPAKGTRGRGRPKLGVVAREVTLLPRHWEWLAAQSGGASVALRKMIDEARRAGAADAGARAARDAAYRFM
jgi:hypothetical protein